MGKVIDLVGQKFGRLTVLEQSGYYTRPNGKREACWKCICDCGTTKIVRGSALRDGTTVSCGCYCREIHTIHGGCIGRKNERLYAVWTNIKGRCYTITDDAYGLYGGRGIKMCDEWHYDYGSFREWALNNGYDETAHSHQCTLDRIDPNGNYCPENCRWADPEVQQNNKRTNFIIEYCGEERTLAQWSKILDVDMIVLWSRLRKYKWTVEKAFTTPVRKRRKRGEYV